VPFAFKDMVAVPNLVGSVVNAAFTVTLEFCEIDEGAVYAPLLEIDPTLGDKDQVTLLVRVADAVGLESDATNCCFCPPVMLTSPGLTLSDVVAGGLSVMNADAVTNG
jgi:hypothetical protein